MNTVNLNCVVKCRKKPFLRKILIRSLHIASKKTGKVDQRFTESYLNSRSQRGYGINRIKQELRQLKGIESATIEAVVRE